MQVGWSFARTGELPHHDHSHVEGLDDEPVRMQPRRLKSMKHTNSMAIHQTEVSNEQHCCRMGTAYPHQTAATWVIGIAASLGAIAMLGNAGIVFALLIGLMLTGMPISIALGLTVLYLPVFHVPTMPTEAVAMKLFTGIEKFEIMAIPFFILAGNFLTHGGVAKRMINFATSMVGHWHGGLAWPESWPAPSLPPFPGQARPRSWPSARS